MDNNHELTLCHRCSVLKAESEMVPSRWNRWAKVCRDCDRAYNRKWRAENPARRREQTVRCRAKAKQEAISHYGGECAHCKESDIAKLLIYEVGATIDTRTGFHRYMQLRKTGWPEGFIVLCWDCKNEARAKARRQEKWDAQAVRTCTTCKQGKSIREFPVNQHGNPHSRCRKCATEYSKAWNRKNRDHVRASKKGIQGRLRQDVIAAYGGKCVCCGEDEPKFLTIDHPESDGAARRQEYGNIGADFYRRLKREGFTEKLQILCYNCNCGRHLNGGICPHQQSEDSVPDFDIMEHIGAIGIAPKSLLAVPAARNVRTSISAWGSVSA